MSSAMSNEEAARAIRNLEPKIEAYAELIVRKGLAVQEGQEVVIQVPVERADFARILVRHAYAAGAGHGVVRRSRLAGRSREGLGLRARRAVVQHGRTSRVHGRIRLDGLGLHW